jgi:hypothetical protein
LGEIRTLIDHSWMGDAGKVGIIVGCVYTGETNA